MLDYYYNTGITGIETPEQRRRRLLGLPPESPGPVDPQQQALEIAQRARATADQQLSAPPVDYNAVFAGAQILPHVADRLRRDSQAPAELRGAVNYTQLEQLRQQQAQQQAARTAETMINTNDASPLLKAQGESGSILKALTLGALGASDAARNELVKAGIMNAQWQTGFDREGRQAQIQVRPDGTPIAGIDSEGRTISPRLLGGYALAGPAGGSAAAMTPRAQDLYVDEAGNPFREFNIGNRVVLRPVGHNNPQAGRLTRSQQSAQLTAETSAARAGAQVVGTSVARQTGRAPLSVPASAYDPTTNSFQPAQQTQSVGPAAMNQGVPSQSMGAPARPVDPAAMNQASATPVSAPARPVDPAAMNQGVPATPVSAPATPVVTGTAPGGLLTPSQLDRQTQLRESNLRREEKVFGANVDTVAQAEKEVSQASASAASTFGAADRIIETARRRPDFFKVLGDGAYKTWVVSQVDSERRAALQRMADNLKISKPDRPLFNRVLADMRQLELTAITGSGLSASQLNSERESERVTQAQGLNVIDGPELAQAQALLARARAETNRQWAQALARARPGESLAAIRDRFDTGPGQRIWDRVNQQITDILDKPQKPGPGAYQDPEKEARYQEWLKTQGQ